MANKSEIRHAGYGHTCTECCLAHWHTDKYWNFNAAGEPLTFDCEYADGTQNRSRDACKHFRQ